jgi:hypothetical protein
MAAITLVAVVAAMAAIAVVAIAMIAVAAATTAMAGTRGNAVLEAFHFESPCRAHLVLHKSENRKNSEPTRTTLTLRAAHFNAL